MALRSVGMNGFKITVGMRSVGLNDYRITVTEGLQNYSDQRSVGLKGTEILWSRGL